MLNRLIRTFALASFLFLASCATAPNIFEGTLGDTEPDAEVGTATDEQKPEVADSGQAPVSVRSLDREELELPAVAYLLDQAEDALINNDLDRAAALSDRALQIERKSARAYLIIARAHQLGNNLRSALSSARQGLLYTTENSFVGRQLTALLGSLDQGSRGLNSR